jgi:hypothetical protein
VSSNRVAWSAPPPNRRNSFATAFGYFSLPLLCYVATQHKRFRCKARAKRKLRCSCHPNSQVPKRLRFFRHSVAALQCFQTDFRESALRNYNAALQNSSVQGLFGRRPCEARGMKLRGNRNQTFGTVSSNFHRNCPNREHKPARFFEGNFRRCRLISALALLYTRLTSGAKRLCS